MASAARVTIEIGGGNHDASTAAVDAVDGLGLASGKAVKAVKAAIKTNELIPGVRD